MNGMVNSKREKVCFGASQVKGMGSILVSSKRPGPKVQTPGGPDGLSVDSNPSLGSGCHRS